ncbi:L,D-transpeptidase [Candidatus Parcubacteria bacterium]|nr:L,D-transpeptidase [Candidatus Parcubacteria bacterium]
MIPSIIFANGLVDSDLDGIPDSDEKNIYFTDVNNPDTDGDGYSDWLELNFGYSPHNPKPVKLDDNDYDGDGLSDRDELRFHTSLINKDTDEDGFSDYEEIEAGYDPLNKDTVLLDKRIEINIGKQELSYFLGGVRMGVFSVSSGINNSTSYGHYKVTNKSPKAWSPYGLWMPYWLGLDSGRFGIHELPIWPNGCREGEDHLGKPASHGCIRLGEGPAELIYNWVPIGTGVFIY